MGVATTLRPAAPPRFVVPSIVEPTTSVDGLDASDLPGRFPSGTWLPIIAGPKEPDLVVAATLNGVSLSALLDTGATNSVLDEAQARRLGVIDEARFLGSREVLTPAGTIAVRAYAAHLVLGGRSFPEAVVNVAERSAVGFVVGFSVLSQVDVYVALHERLIGIFDAGRAPVAAGAQALDLVTYADGVCYVDAFVTTASGDAFHDAVPLLIDTGATSTSLPRQVLVGRRALHRSEAITIGGEVDDAHFDTGELVLGRRHMRVGRVVPTSSTAAYGNLGLDVLGRFHVVLSSARRLAFFTPAARRPAQRTRGPGGETCARGGAPQPCITVSLDVIEAPRLCATIAPGFGPAPLALDVSAERDDGTAAWGGGHVTLFVRPKPAWHTVCEPLPVDPRAPGPWSAARLALQWVDRPRSFPCDGRSCIGRGAPLP